MAKETAKLGQSKKLVEVPPELSEDVRPSATLSQESSTDLSFSSGTQLRTENAFVEQVAVEAPQAVLQDKLWLMTRFTVITVVIGYIPYMLAPGFLLPSFHSTMVRTCAFI